MDGVSCSGDTKNGNDRTKGALYKRWEKRIVMMQKKTVERRDKVSGNPRNRRDQREERRVGVGRQRMCG